MSLSNFGKRPSASGASGRASARIALLVGAMTAATSSVPASSQGQPAPAEAHAGATTAIPRSIDGKPDFTGVWTFYPQPGSNPFGVGARPPEPPFTVEGKRRRDEYMKLTGPQQDNPGAFCVPYGMPTMMQMAGGYPIEFIQKPDQLTIIFEVEGETRRVYFGARNIAPEDRLPTRQGYSSGRWEGDTLIVDTDTLTESVDQMRFPRSEQAKIAERFQLLRNPEGARYIAYHMTLTDPVYYNTPVEFETKWLDMPSGRIMAYNCTEEPWHRLLDARREQLKAGKPITAKMGDVVDIY